MDASQATHIPPTRTYQQEMLDTSLRQNTVIAMDTGSGKTHIAILRMKIEAEREPNKLSWFTAPTVSLCEQQRHVISTSIPVPVGLISGALEPDQWIDQDLWKVALSTHRIMVSTPQILLDALRHGYINLGRDIGLLIFDEAHHAADKHPYNMIMREFYDDCEPRDASILGPSKAGVKPFVLGLTASPVFGGNIDKAFTKIERNLDSTILAPRLTRSDLLKHVHRPVFKHILYPPLLEAPDPCEISANVSALSSVVRTLDIQIDPSVKSLRSKLAEASNPTDQKRIDQRLSRAVVKGDTFVHKGMHDFLRTARELCVDLGPWAADWYVSSVVKKALKGNADTLHILFSERNRNEKAYLLKILKSIPLVDISYDRVEIARRCSPKANELIKCLLKEKEGWEARGEMYSGLIFVTRRDCALALTELLNYHPKTQGIFSIGTLLGNSENNKRNAFLDITRTMLSQKHSDVIADFRIGEKNLVISTAVAEEGIDIQACGSVIRWDLPQNMVSWAQSRGRTRRKESTFILMFEGGGCHALQIQKWERLENEMIKKYLDKQRLLSGVNDTEEEDSEEEEYLEFQSNETGAKVTLHSAISHIAHFCNTLPIVFRTDIQATYDVEPPDYPQGFHDIPSASMYEIRNEGPYGATLTLPRLLPPDKRVFKTEEKYKTKKSARRHAAFKAYAALRDAGLLNENLLPLCGSVLPLQEEVIHNILVDVEKRESLVTVREQINPWCAANSESDNDYGGNWYSNEVTVEGVASFTMLTLKNLQHINSTSSTLYDPEYGPRQFTIRPLGMISLSESEIVSGRHFTRRLFSVFYGHRMNWDNLNYAYLFLPPRTGIKDIWEGRRTWADSIRTSSQELGVRECSWIEAGMFGEHYKYPSDVFMITVWNRFYRFQGWRMEKLSSEEEEAVRKRYSRVKNLEITYPLIIAQPIRHRLNFLVSPSDRPAEQNSITLPTSLAKVVLDSEMNILFGLFLPSILRVVFTKLVALSLRETLSNKAPLLKQVPLNLVETALMAPSANDQFDYQRLENLGDTILKFIATIQLLAEHPHWPEGFLAKRKDHAVSNEHLAQSAIGKRLYRWIIRRGFIVRKWRPDFLDEDENYVAGADELEDDSLIEDDSNISVYIEGEEKADKGKDKELRNIFEKLSTKTLADVVESLIGAAYLSGGFNSSIECANAFDISIGSAWQPLEKSVAKILSHVGPLLYPPTQLSYPEKILGHTFSKKLLLVEALMHVNCQSELQSMSYERMELLGDALLDVIVTETLYRKETKCYTPGEMHERKAALVNTHFLAFLCLRANVVLDAKMPSWDAPRALVVTTTERHITRLAQCLLHSSGEILEEQRNAFDRFRHGCDEIERGLERGSTFPWAALARLQAPKFMSDILESTLGAVYVDSEGNMDAVKTVLERVGLLRVLERLMREDVDVTHPVTRVMEWAGKHQLVEDLRYQMKRDRNRITCVLILGEEIIASVTKRYNGKASEDDVRFQASEEGYPILLQKYGDK
ncbi:hypothetical protein EW145_g1776 [Phellinidium pouzarii]|uniref:Dicer-like protein 2 n=1 Tax=Phellinidium pouzarii TaxID=167371 RepID=A0A4S4LD56_9AGAM|nr:hypothetical protein EW145_g1776 [Phellinidium pouzarii]